MMITVPKNARRNSMMTTIRVLSVPSPESELPLPNSYIITVWLFPYPAAIPVPSGDHLDYITIAFCSTPSLMTLSSRPLSMSLTFSVRSTPDVAAISPLGCTSTDLTQL